MSGKFLFLSFTLFTANLLPGASVPHTDAAQHIGEEVTVTGKVSRVSTIPSGMTFINFGARGEAGAFTAVARPGIGDAETLKSFEGQTVEVTGTVELYKDSPQIVLKSADAIRLPGEAPAPTDENMKKPAQAAAWDIRTFTVALDKKEVKAAGETSAGAAPSKAHVAIALPKGFQPTENQRILAVFPDFFSDGDQEKLLTPYAQVAAPKGWVVLTARGPLLDLDLPDAWHSVMFQAALRQLSEEFPGIAEWSFYLAGNADGASRATVSTGVMMENDLEVKGIYVSSLKRESITRSVEAFGPSKIKLKKIKVFVSHGSDDNMVSEEASLAQSELIREAGIQDVRHENHDGRGGVDPKSFTKALEWFEEAE